MEVATSEIERIVRAVLADLGRAAAPTAAAPAAAKGQPSVAPAKPAADELVLQGRLVTMAELSGRLQGIRRVLVAPRAVVTPAVRDELRRRSVTLGRATATAAASPTVWRLTLTAAGKRLDPAPLAESLRRDGIDVEAGTADCLIAATDRLAAEIKKPRTLGALLTGHWAAALCLANRHPGVRAAGGRDPATALAAVRDVGANLLVLDPAGTALDQLKQTIIEFCRGGTHDCPEPLRGRLG